MTVHPIAFKRVEKRTEAKHRPPDLSPAEYRSYFAIVEKLRPDLVILFKLLIHSGADIGELIGVESKKKKLPRKPGLMVRDCYLDRDLPRLRLIRTKTNTPERHVPIPKNVAVALQAHIELRGLRSGDEVFGGSGEKFGITYEEAAWVHERVRISITRPDLKIKSLRHVAAIYWRRAGVDLITIRDYLGHSTVSQTQIYAEFGPDDEWEAPTTEGAYRLLAVSAAST
jgi:integrase